MSVAGSIEMSVSSPVPGRARRVGDGAGDDEQEGTRAPGGARRPRRGPGHGRASGAAGLVSRRRGRPSNRRYPDAVREAALAAIRERYPDFGPTLAAEKLAEVHDLELGRETVRRWMVAAGPWTPRRDRGVRVHQPRPR